MFLIGNFQGLTWDEAQDTALKKLTFPEGYPPTSKSRYEPCTAIKQFSNGRNHILGLADDGKIWYWARRGGLQIKFLHVDLTEKNVSRVVAGSVVVLFAYQRHSNVIIGWHHTSVYAIGTGIIYWTPKLPPLEEGQDTLLIDPTIVPNTGHIQNTSGRTSDVDLEHSVGEVITHVVLENYIVFITKLNKVFAYNTSPAAEVSQHYPFELTSFYPSSDSEPVQLLDLQGSYRSFAVFTAAGDVLVAQTPLLDAFFDALISETEPAEPLPRPTRPPYLQQSDVIYLAMGDHHFHALHANGTVSSFGKDPRMVGALGLGNVDAMFRGVRKEALSGDGTLDGSKRRTVWFERLLQKRVRDILADPHDENEPGAESVPNREIRDRVNASNELRDAYGDYFEEEGRRWEDGITDANEMGAYFAFKVSAAGWHSAALVLVDEEKAERARRKHILSPVEPLSPPAAPEDDCTSPRSNTSSHAGPASLWNLYAYAVSQLVWLIRWFLGLTARDAAAAAAGSTGGASGEEPSEPARVRYVWEDQPLPRLWETDAGDDEHEGNAA